MSEIEQRTIRTQAVVVKLAREKLAQQETELKGLQEAFDKEHAGLISAIAQEKAWVSEQEADLRTLALAAFEADKTNKKPGPGVGIREVTKLEYPQGEAFAWAVEHKLCLQLDKKAFEGFVKGDPATFTFGHKWLKVEIEAQATIAVDLSAALAKEGDGSGSK